MNRKDVLARTALVGLMAGMATGGAYASEKLFDLAHQTSQQAAQITQLSRSLDASRQQLRVHGITPAVPSSQDVIAGAHTAPSPAPSASVNVEPVGVRRNGGGSAPASGALNPLYAVAEPRRKF